MTNIDYQKTLKAIREQGKKNRSSKKAAMKYLVESGFITKSGKPTKAYQ